MSRPQFPPPPLLDPGWYADPTGGYEARYWDGLKWTGHISHYGATGNDPIVRARFDRLWIRIIGKVVFWAIVLCFFLWMVKTYWPDGGDNTDDKNGASGSVSLIFELEVTPMERGWVLGEIQG